MGERRRQFLERLPLAANRRIVAYGAAVAISAAAFLIRMAVNHQLPPGYPYLTFFPAVILTSFLFGTRPGIVAAVLCGLASWIFFIGPNAGALAFSGGILLSLGFYAMIVTIDITLIHWMQAANQRLREERARGEMLVERGDLLFRELQHRVSNNIQVVAALLSLQKRNVADPAARTALDDAVRRLGLIGRIHRQLHDPDGGRQDMGAFLQSIAGDLLDASGRTGVRVDVDADPGIRFEADAAIPIALIVAEAISNAIEHGFADRDHGVIEVCLQRLDEGGVALVISDDGAGLAPGFDVERSDSLGLRIARTLARQLNGDFRLLPRAEGPGTMCRVHIAAASAIA